VFENLTRFDIILFPVYIIRSCLFWKMNFVVFFGFLFHQFINISWSRYVGGLFGWFKYFLGCFYFFYHFQFYPSKFDSLTLLGFAGVFFFKIFFFNFTSLNFDSRGLRIFIFFNSFSMMLSHWFFFSFFKIYLQQLRSTI
jgi:hypothetical protein